MLRISDHRWAALGAILLAALIFTGCTKTDYVTNVIDSPQGIVGRVQPYTAGIEIALWQAVSVAKVPPDTAGYFTFANLKPGLYEVRITSPAGLGKVISEVAVRENETTSLGTITLSSLPWPLISVWPRDGQTACSRSIGILLATEVALDMSSLETAVTLTPNVAGSWVLIADQPYEYRFTPATGLSCAQTYQMRIAGTLKLATGEAWGHVLTTQFATEEFALDHYDRLSYYYRDTVPSGWSGQMYRIWYNGLIEEMSLTSAVTVDPPIQFRTDISGDGTFFDFVIEGGLVSNRAYNLILGAGIRDKAGNTVGHPDTIMFYTQSFSAVSHEYPAGRTSISPRGNQRLAEIEYSAELLPSSLAGAFSVSPAAPIIAYVESPYYNDNQRYVYIECRGALTPGQTYRLIIDSTLRAADGATLGKADTMHFTVAMPRLTRYGFDDCYYCGPDTVLNPGEPFNLRFYFNSAVDIDSINTAVTIDPPLEGFWYGPDISGDSVAAFFPTGPNPTPGQIYTVTVKGDVGICGGVNLGSDKVFSVVVLPPQAQSISPAPGSLQYSSAYVTISFNCRMDHVSTESAFQMTTWSGAPVSGYFSWTWNGDKYVEFHPSTSLTLGETYRAVLTTDAKSKEGVPIAKEESTFFRVAY